MKIPGIPSISAIGYWISIQTKHRQTRWWLTSVNFSFYERFSSSWRWNHISIIVTVWMSQREARQTIKKQQNIAYISVWWGISYPDGFIGRQRKTSFEYFYIFFFWNSIATATERRWIVSKLIYRKSMWRLKISHFIITVTSLSYHILETRKIARIFFILSFHFALIFFFTDEGKFGFVGYNWIFALHFFQFANRRIIALESLNLSGNLKTFFFWVEKTELIKTA